jgi:uncharacterized membrane protein
MTTEALTTVVVGYDDTETALHDFHDLEKAHEEDRLPGYDAAVLERRPDATYTIVATTVVPRQRNTLRAAGLGLVVGVLAAPGLAVAAVGATIGAAVGTILDRFDAVSHSDLARTRSLMDDSLANLVVITDEAHAESVESIAASRPNRTIVPISPDDVDVLRRELQRDHHLFGA